jgi:hypothetical protein
LNWRSDIDEAILTTITDGQKQHLLASLTRAIKNQKLSSLVKKRSKSKGEIVQTRINHPPPKAFPQW